MGSSSSSLEHSTSPVSILSVCQSLRFSELSELVLLRPEFSVVIDSPKTKSFLLSSIVKICFSYFRDSIFLRRMCSGFNLILVLIMARASFNPRLLFDWGSIFFMLLRLSVKLQSLNYGWAYLNDRFKSFSETEMKIKSGLTNDATLEGSNPAVISWSMAACNLCVKSWVSDSGTGSLRLTMSLSTSERAPAG